MAGERAWSYLVVSSDKQAETLVHQRAWADETAKANGWQLARVGEFEDVSSGKDGPRKLILRVLAELERLAPADRPTWLLMLRLDRVGRGSIVESQVVVHKLKQLGVRVWTRDQGEIKNDSAMDELMVAIASTVARMENDVKREKSTNAHKRIKKAGLHPGHAPFGTVLVDRRPVAYEPEAVIVREIYARRLRGWGVHKLARWAAKNAPPKRKNDGSLRELKWGTGTIEGMLRCKSYRDTVVDAHTFDAVQNMRKPARRREAIYPWPLRGAVKCTCGYILTGTRGGSGPDLNRYYHCKNVAKHDSYPMHRADVLEAQFAEILRTITVHPEITPSLTVEDATPLRGRKRTLEHERAELEKRKAATWEIAEAGNIKPAQLQERLNALDIQIAELDASISEATTQISDIEHAAQASIALRDVVAEIAEAWADPQVDIEARQDMASAVAALLRGLWVEPGAKGTAALSRLRTGIEMNGGFDYGLNWTHIRNYLNRSTEQVFPAKR